MTERRLRQKRAELRALGVNLKAWARERGLPYDAVRDVLRGKARGHRGDAHRAAVALGLKPDPLASRAAA